MSLRWKIGDPLYTTFQKIFTIIRIFLKSEAPKAPGLFTFVHRGGLDKFLKSALELVSTIERAKRQILSSSKSSIFAHYTIPPTVKLRYSTEQMHNRAHLKMLCSLKIYPTLLLEP